MGALRRVKTKRLTRGLDQVHADLASPRHLQIYKESKTEEDLPGLGRFYCTECAKWFEGEHNLVQHRRGKNHKRRVRLLKEEPHTQKLAEAVIGIGTDNGTRAAVEEMDIAETPMAVEETTEAVIT